MTEIEIKSLKAQIQLLKEIKECDAMILHAIRSDAATLIENVITKKMFFEKDQTTVELSEKEFTEIRLFIARLDFSTNALGELAKGISEKYIVAKDEKIKILQMLQ